MQLDFFIVLVSALVLALDTLSQKIQFIKGLRVLRALKPLRQALEVPTDPFKCMPL